MWRESKRENGIMTTTNNTVLSVQANRRKGKTGNVYMKFENGRFLEYDWQGFENEEEAMRVYEGL